MTTLEERFWQKVSKGDGLAAIRRSLAESNARGSITSLAREYGVSRPTISAIYHRRNRASDSQV